MLNYFITNARLTFNKITKIIIRVAKVVEKLLSLILEFRELEEFRK